MPSHFRVWRALDLVRLEIDWVWEPGGEQKSDIRHSGDGGGIVMAVVHLIQVAGSECNAVRQLAPAHERTKGGAGSRIDFTVIPRPRRAAGRGRPLRPRWSRRQSRSPCSCIHRSLHTRTTWWVRSVAFQPEGRAVRSPDPADRGQSYARTG